VGCKLKPLDDQEGLNYIVNNWAYTRPGTKEYTKKMLESLPSSGVYMNSQTVSSIMLNATGLLGMLYTSKEHRGKSLAKFATQFLMKQMGVNGLPIASAVEQHNGPSNRFHLKAGLKYSHECDYIYNNLKDF